MFDDRLPNVIYTGHSFLSPAEFESCVPLDMKINGTSVFPTLSVDSRSNSMSSSSSISPVLCLPPPARSVHCGMKVSQGHIADKAPLRGVNRILGVGWPLHQPSHAFDDISTPVFDQVLVIVVPSHILKSV